MKKILLPTDFSANAWNAISYAIQFYKDEECRFFGSILSRPLIKGIGYHSKVPVQVMHEL